PGATICGQIGVDTGGILTPTGIVNSAFTSQGTGITIQVNTACGTTNESTALVNALTAAGYSAATVTAGGISVSPNGGIS
ncbi:MAG: prepilin-type N-terminal cleavage/methylation domain-containing protein, partial [Acidithiobacillus sp.]